MGIIIALVIFGVIVTVHEFGHFICAKLSGIKVNEFAVGMGPKILSRRKGETLYSLRLLPVGGFCAMEGEDLTTKDPRSFRNAKLWKRMIVLIAGALMNFVLGFVLLIVLSLMFDEIPTTQILGFPGVKNDDGSITYYSQSYKDGLRKDDIIVEMDGTAVYSILDLNYCLETGEDDTHSVTVLRDGKRTDLGEITFHNEETGKYSDFGLVTLKKTPVSVTRCSGQIFRSMGHIIMLSLKQIISGKAGKDAVSGPVGVVSAISETAEQSVDLYETVFQLLYMTSLITINLGIFNLLPIPGLDGGRLLFCIIELIRRKPVKPEHEGYVHLAGMALLILIMLFATYNDIVRLITGG